MRPSHCHEEWQRTIVCRSKGSCSRTRLAAMKGDSRKLARNRRRGGHVGRSALLMRRVNIRKLFCGWRMDLVPRMIEYCLAIRIEVGADQLFAGQARSLVDDQN